MIKNTFLLREEFKEWLLEYGKFPLPSANSYLSYVAGADKYCPFFTSESNEAANLFQVLKVKVEYGDSAWIKDTIINLIDQLQQENIDIKLNTPISTINKWRSGLFQYINFLFYYIENKIEPLLEFQEEEDAIDEKVSESLEPFKFLDEDNEKDLSLITLDLNDFKTNYNYSKLDVYKIFFLRIITQDRFYKHIFYPIGFIKRILYLKGEKQFMDKWVENLLDSIDIHLEIGKIKLFQISELNIKNGSVLVKHNGEYKIVLTKLSDNKTLIPFKVDLMRQIAIDHEKPLVKILLENLDQLVIFKEITNELKKYLSGTVNPYKLKVANNKVLQTDYVDKLNIDGLKNELTFLSSKTNLQLMDRLQNLIKKATDN